MVRFLLVVFVSFVLVACGGKQPESDYEWNLPKGYPRPTIPHDNPMTEARVQLGRYLFYDNNLSANKAQSCASCHIQSLAFSEPLPVSVGSTGEILKRNASSLVNVGYNATLTWAHPYLRSIERQVLIPMFNEEPLELGITGFEDEIMARFDNDLYKPLFKEAFGDEEVEFDRIAKALSAFVRSLVSFNSPFDRYANMGIDDAMTEQEIRGMDVFFSEEFDCHHCHGGFNFTQSIDEDEEIDEHRPFHNIGMYNIDGKGSYPADHVGAFEITRRKKDMGGFRAPTLRNVGVSAPYMHDGSFTTLEEVLDFYIAGGRLIEDGPFKGDGRENPYKSQFVRPLEMSDEQKTDLIAFLKALTDEEFLTNPAHSNPFVGAD
ncbi:methanobactin export MATE transporter MbnM [Sessilibacter corallicola]|uniref:methanobactin export MATE transporter MbnM n=1 Tax=Sessilibacter corallicola TaxID=2904075 RepID=UPI001E5CD812|nr:methanobactin export MATE transporter MbnM [Sessilibacter corallicola]MCE2028172.1 di-heme enzyme [Sessilibacter corallicola]